MPAYSDWYNQNEVSSYPISLSASQLGAVGELLPEDIICDLHIWFPRTAGKYAAISSVTVTEYLVAVTLAATDYQPGDSIPPGYEFTPLAAITLIQLVDLYRNHTLQALYPGTGGWIAFGKGAQTQRLNWRGENVTAGFIVPKVSFSYSDLPFTGVTPADNLALELTGLVNLQGDQGVEIVRDTRKLNGVEKECLVIQLSNDLTLEETRSLIGSCARLAEHGECDPPVLRTINGVGGDANGNVTITDTGTGDGYLLPVPAGLILLSNIDLSDHCSNVRRLPDKCGNLPDPRFDPCTEGRWNWCSSEIPTCDRPTVECDELVLPAIPSNVHLFTTPALSYYNRYLVSAWKFEDDNYGDHRPIPDILGRNDLLEQATWTRETGKDGYGFNFTHAGGDYNELYIQGGTGLAFDCRGFTIAFWMKRTGTPAFADLIYKNKTVGLTLDYNIGKFYLEFLTFWWAGPTAQPQTIKMNMTDSVGFNIGDWHLVVLRANPGEESPSKQMVIDIDNVTSVGSPYRSGIFLSANFASDPTTRFSIGTFNSCEPDFIEIDEFYVWYRPLTNAAVAELYNSGVGRFLEIT